MLSKKIYVTSITMSGTPQRRRRPLSPPRLNRAVRRRTSSPNAPQIPRLDFIPRANEAQFIGDLPTSGSSSSSSLREYPRPQRMEFSTVYGDRDQILETIQRLRYEPEVLGVKGAQHLMPFNTDTATRVAARRERKNKNKVPFARPLDGVQAYAYNENSVIGIPVETENFSGIAIVTSDGVRLASPDKNFFKKAALANFDKTLPVAKLHTLGGRSSSPRKSSSDAPNSWTYHSLASPFGKTKKKYIVYGVDTCPWCRKAYKLLEKHDLDYQSKTPLKTHTTIPQIYEGVGKNKKHIGGFVELSKALRKKRKPAAKAKAKKVPAKAKGKKVPAKAKAKKVAAKAKAKKVAAKRRVK